MPYKDPEKAKAAKAEWYQKNKSKINKTNGWTTRSTYKKYIELKSNPCVDCGGAFHFSAMQFDHIGSDKVGAVSKLAKHSSMQAMLDEIAKCELVCANCHHIRTWQRLHL